MNTALSVAKKALTRLLCGLLTMLLLVGLVGCIPIALPSRAVEDKKEEPTSGSSKNGTSTKDGDDEIIAGTADTSSNYSLEVKGAFVGMDEYSDSPVVILVCEFTNDSDKTISYSSALDALAFQDGRKLKTAYLRGASSYTYEDVKPGATTPVLIGWELVSATYSVKITVADRYHYAKEVLFENTYTIDELIANTKRFIEEFSGIVDESQGITV